MMTTNSHHTAPDAPPQADKTHTATQQRQFGLPPSQAGTIRDFDSSHPTAGPLANQPPPASHNRSASKSQSQTHNNGPTLASHLPPIHTLNLDQSLDVGQGADVLGPLPRFPSAALVSASAPATPTYPTSGMPGSCVCRVLVPSSVSDLVHECPVHQPKRRNSNVHAPHLQPGATGNLQRAHPHSPPKAVGPAQHEGNWSPVRRGASADVRNALYTTDGMSARAGSNAPSIRTDAEPKMIRRRPVPERALTTPHISSKHAVRAIRPMPSASPRRLPRGSSLQNIHSAVAQPVQSVHPVQHADMPGTITTSPGYHPSSQLPPAWDPTVGQANALGLHDTSASHGMPLSPAAAVPTASAPPETVAPAPGAAPASTSPHGPQRACRTSRSLPLLGRPGGGTAPKSVTSVTNATVGGIPSSASRAGVSGARESTSPPQPQLLSPSQPQSLSQAQQFESHAQGSLQSPMHAHPHATVALCASTAPVVVARKVRARPHRIVTPGNVLAPHPHLRQHGHQQQIEGGGGLSTPVSPSRAAANKPYARPAHERRSPGESRARSRPQLPHVNSSGSLSSSTNSSSPPSSMFSTSPTTATTPSFPSPPKPQAHLAPMQHGGTGTPPSQGVNLPPLSAVLAGSVTPTLNNLLNPVAEI